MTGLSEPASASPLSAAPLRTVGAVVAGIERAAAVIAAICLGAMLGLVVLAVTARTLGLGTFAGYEEPVVWLVVALVFFGYPVAAGQVVAMRLDILTERLPPRGRWLAGIIADATVVEASLVLVSGGFEVMRLIGGRAPVMDLPEAWRFLPVVIGGGFGAALPVLRRLAAREPGAGVAAAALGLALFWLSHAGGALLPDVGAPSLVAGVVAFGLLALGAPLSHALLAGLSLAAPFGALLPEAALVQTTVAGIGKLLLTAVPFFLLAAVAMNAGGLARRLVDFAAALVGHRRGGLAQTTLLTNLLFAGVSGSSVADAAFGGKVLVPALVAHGYDRTRAVAIVAATAVLPNIVPPSIAFLILALATNLSVGALFTGGLVAGLVLAAALAVALHLDAPALPASPPSPWATRGRTLLAALPVIGLGCLIFFSIDLGFLTPTEAAAAAAIYALVHLGVMSRGRGLARALYEAGREGAAVGLLIAAAAPFGFLIAVDRGPQALVQALTELGGGPAVFMLAANALLLVTGCFLDIGAAILLLGPLLVPVAVALGLGPIGFGVVVVVNLMIGGLTPPVGILIYVASGVAGVPATAAFRAVLPYVATLIGALALIAAAVVVFPLP